MSIARLQHQLDELQDLEDQESRRLVDPLAAFDPVLDKLSNDGLRRLLVMIEEADAAATTGKKARRGKAPPRRTGKPSGPALIDDPAARPDWLTEFTAALDEVNTRDAEDEDDTR